MQKLSGILFFICSCAVFAQKNKPRLNGIWVEYKREIAGDTSATKYTIDGKAFHPDLYFTVTDEDFLFSNLQKTLQYEYELVKDTLVLSGFDKVIYKRKFLYKRLSKKELILTEVAEGNPSGFRRMHYFKRSPRYPPRSPFHYETFTGKDVYPHFPGGQDSLQRFYKAHYKKPAIIDELDYYPAVQVMLAISEKGKIVHAEILGQPFKELAEEAIRLIRLMPDWDMGPQSDFFTYRKGSQSMPTFTYYPIEIVFKPKM